MYLGFEVSLQKLHIETRQGNVSIINRYKNTVMLNLKKNVHRTWSQNCLTIKT